MKVLVENKQVPANAPWIGEKELDTDRLLFKVDNGVVYLKTGIASAEWTDWTDFVPPSNTQGLLSESSPYPELQWIQECYILNSIKLGPNQAKGFFYNTRLQKVEGLNNFDTTNCTSFAYMFAGAFNDGYQFPLDLHTWNTSNVQVFESCFQTESYASMIEYINISNWDFSSAINMERFCYFPITGIKRFVRDDYWNTDNVSVWMYTFRGLNVKQIPQFSIKSAILLIETFSQLKAEILVLNNPEWVVRTPRITVRRMFNDCPLLEHVYVNEDWYPFHEVSGQVFYNTPNIHNFNGETGPEKAIIDDGTNGGYFEVAKEGTPRRATITPQQIPGATQQLLMDANPSHLFGWEQAQYIITEVWNYSIDNIEKIILPDGREVSPTEDWYVIFDRDFQLTIVGKG